MKTPKEMAEEAEKELKKNPDIDKESWNLIYTFCDLAEDIKQFIKDIIKR